MTGTAMECIAWLSTQKDGMFDVEIHKEKRSLNANALYHKMVNQIAKALKISNAAAHNQLLRKYGVHQIIEGDEVWIALPDTPETEKTVEEDEYNHFQPTMRKTADVCNIRLCEQYNPLILIEYIFHACLNKSLPMLQLCY